MTVHIILFFMQVEKKCENLTRKVHLFIITFGTKYKNPPKEGGGKRKTHGKIFGHSHICWLDHRAAVRVYDRQARTEL